jgi:hypothetical protein
MESDNSRGTIKTRQLVQYTVRCKGGTTGCRVIDDFMGYHQQMPQAVKEFHAMGWESSIEHGWQCPVCLGK